jgi:hypothetical protein
LLDAARMRKWPACLLILLALGRPASGQGVAPVAAFHFDEGSGPTAHDATGHGHDGTVTGAAWTPAGRHGGALAFDGVDDWVTVAAHPALNLSTGLTVEAWVYPTGFSGYQTVAMREMPGGLAYVLYANDQAPWPAIWIQADGTDVEAPGAAPLPLNEWTHLAATYDGVTLELFFNGVPAGSRAVSGAISDISGVLRFGGNAVWGEYFTGLLDEIRIYDRALSAAEIQTDAATPIGTYPDDDVTPPTVSLTSPAGGIVSGTITIRASASDAGGIAGVQFRLNDSNFGEEDETPPFEIDWATSFRMARIVSPRRRATARATPPSPVRST